MFQRILITQVGQCLFTFFIFFLGSHRSLFKTLSGLREDQLEVDAEVNLEYGRCSREDCGGFSYDSTIDAERHLRHGERQAVVDLNLIVHFSDHGLGTKDAVAPAGYQCAFEVEGGVKCGLRFPTRKAINDHKRKEEHIKRKKKENAGNGENTVDDDLEFHENEFV